MGSNPSGSRQNFDDVSDLFIVSHSSDVYSQNLIEVKNVNTDNVITTLKILESDYPFANDGIDRTFGVSLRVSRIPSPTEESVDLGFEVTVLDLPVMD